MKPHFLDSIRRLILFIALAGLLVACNPQDKAANTGLTNFKSMLKAGATGLATGFSLSAAGIDSLTLGRGVQVYLIKLDSIKQAHANETQSMLYDAKQYMYPIYYQNVVVSSEEVAQINNVWQVRSYGEQETMQSFETYQSGRSYTAGPYLVRIPALSLDFLGGQFTGTPGFTLSYIGPHSLIADTASIDPGKVNTLDYVMHKLQPTAEATTVMP